MHETAAHDIDPDWFKQKSFCEARGIHLPGPLSKKWNKHRSNLVAPLGPREKELRCAEEQEQSDFCWGWGRGESITANLERRSLTSKGAGLIPSCREGGPSAYRSHDALHRAEHLVSACEIQPTGSGVKKLLAIQEMQVRSLSL